MHIYIPTRGRIEKQSTWDNFPEELRQYTTLVCPKEEVEEHIARGRKAIARPDYVKGISASRQFIMEQCPSNLFIMVDDDMRFFVRKDPSAWNLRQATAEDTIALFKRMWKMLEGDEYAAVGLSTRQNINVKYPATVLENTKINGVMGFDRDAILDTGSRFDDVQIQEDYHIVLSLLENGYKVASICDAAWNQTAETGAPGGCSLYRTNRLQEDGSWKLQELHPKYVKVVEKEYKTSSGEELGSNRIDVIVYWKKAYQYGK